MKLRKVEVKPCSGGTHLNPSTGKANPGGAL